MAIVHCGLVFNNDWILILSLLRALIYIHDFGYCAPAELSPGVTAHVVLGLSYISGACMNPVELDKVLPPRSSGHPRVEIVRLTTAHEARLILPLLRVWHTESHYSHLPLSEAKFLTHIVKCIARGDNGALFYAVWRGEVVGMTDVAAGEAWLHEGGRFATCLTWYVRPDLRPTFLGARVARQLHDRVKRWARDGGASQLFINGTSGPNNSLPRLGKLMGHNIAVDLA